MENTPRASPPALIARQTGIQFFGKGQVPATGAGLRLRELISAPPGIQANGR
jgi:hypothetical protein